MRFCSVVARLSYTLHATKLCNNSCASILASNNWIFRSQSPKKYNYTLRILKNEVVMTYTFINDQRLWFFLVYRSRNLDLVNRFNFSPLTVTFCGKQPSQTEEGSIVSRWNIQQSQVDELESVWCNYLVAITSNDQWLKTITTSLVFFK